MPSYDNFSQKFEQSLFSWAPLICLHHGIVPFLGLHKSCGDLGLVLPIYENGNINNFVRKDPTADVLCLVRILLVEKAALTDYLYSYWT